MGRSYADLVLRGRSHYGDRFSESDLAPRFRRYYESGERVRVRFSYGEATGTIGATTGWRPAFLLMRTARSIGSSYVLSERDTVVAVKHGRTYRTVTP